jgi:xylulokinase
MALVLGVDSSTQSTKVEVRDVDDGTLVATGRAAHPAVHPPRSEQPPRAWWEALRSAVAQAGRRDIAALSVAGQQHGMVVLDGTGTVLRDAKLWNDTESAGVAADLTRRMDPTAWAGAVGSVPVAAFTITKLGWLARHEPDLLQRLASVLLPHDYLGFLLTGQYATDRGDASGTGYFNPTDGEWRLDLLDRFVAPGPWAERLPAVLGPTEPVGPATGQALEALGLVGPVLVGPGTGDNMAAALGIALEPGEVAMSLGTSGTVYANHDRPSADPTGIVAGFADATGRYLPLVCTLNATRVTAAVARWLGVTEAELGSLAADAPASSHGPVLVPYLDGERTPNRPNATGTLIGLDTGTTRAQIARAAFEGVVCGLLDGLDALSGTTATSPARIVLVGGGANSPTYRQTVADLSGLPVVIRTAGEHVATGACVQAAATLTGQPIAEIQKAWNLDAGTVVEPDPRVERDAIRHRYRNAATSTPDTRDHGDPTT